MNIKESAIRMRALYKYGGFPLLICKLRSKIKGTKEADEMIYHIAESAKPSDYPKLLEAFYEYYTFTPLDLKDPQTFNEKIQWMKLYDSTPKKTLLADKYLMRDWIKEKIGEEYLIPLLGVWDSFDEIDFDALPNQFVLKANHGSGMNIIVTDKTHFNIDYAREQFNTWMKKDFAFMKGFQMHYSPIPRKIIAETYISEMNADGLVDYRFYCFNGVPKQVWVDMYSGTPKHIRGIYNMNWEKLPFRCTWPDSGNLFDNPPTNFQKMKEFSELLSQEFAFVRVDFFEVNGKLYMGEMTFTPMSGIGNFQPESWNNLLGAYLTLPEKYEGKI